MRATFILVSVVVVGACNTRRATPADCELIFSAIVSKELQEQGYRDPALVEKKRKELHAQLAPELSHCIGRPVQASALACVKRASSTEQISHECLH